jgi:hypothetical protein
MAGHLVFVVSTERVIMCPVIDNHDSCEIRAVINFIHAKTLVLWKSIMNYAWFTAKM